MNYTADEELMAILSELAHDIQGYNYTVKNGQHPKVLEKRAEKLNARIEELRLELNTIHQPKT